MAAAFAALVAVICPPGRAFAEPPSGTADATEIDAAPRTPRVNEHGLGLGYQVLYLRTESTDSYALQGPTVVYDYFIGRRWGFMLRLAAHFPTYGNMSGPSGDFDGSLVDVYDQHHYGVDGMFMVARRKPLSPRFVMTLAWGLHVQWFSLAGTRYSPVEDVSMGIGGLGKLDYQLNGWSSLSAQVAAGVDPFDLIDHHNAASLVVPLSCSFAFAARY